MKSGRGGAGHFRPAEKPSCTSTTQPRNAGPEPLRASSTARAPFGLRVRVSLDTTQRFLFGDDGPSLPTGSPRSSAFSSPASSSRDFRIHSQLDRTVPAVLRNVRLGFWSCARRAALDAARLACGAASRPSALHGYRSRQSGLRLAGLCEDAERSVRIERQQVEDRRRAVRSEFAAMHRERREQESRRRAEAEESR